MQLGLLHINKQKFAVRVSGQSKIKMEDELIYMEYV